MGRNFQEVLYRHLKITGKNYLYVYRSHFSKGRRSITLTKGSKKQVTRQRAQEWSCHKAPRGREQTAEQQQRKAVLGRSPERCIHAKSGAPKVQYHLDGQTAALESCKVDSFPFWTE